MPKSQNPSENVSSPQSGHSISQDCMDDTHPKNGTWERQGWDLSELLPQGHCRKQMEVSPGIAKCSNTVINPY